MDIEKRNYGSKGKEKLCSHLIEYGIGMANKFSTINIQQEWTCNKRQLALLEIHTEMTIYIIIQGFSEYINEPPRGKTNNVVSDQVQHKPACTVTEDG